MPSGHLRRAVLSALRANVAESFLDAAKTALNDSFTLQSQPVNRVFTCHQPFPGRIQIKLFPPACGRSVLLPVHADPRNRIQLWLNYESDLACDITHGQQVPSAVIFSLGSPWKVTFPSPSP